MARFEVDGQSAATAEVGRVVWTDAALADVDAITDYVANFNLAAAKRLRSRIFVTTEGLAAFPLKGRLISGPVRSWGLIYPYAVRYRIDKDDDVLILRIRHGARRPTWKQP